MRIDERPEFTQKPAPATVTPDATVADAVGVMADNNYGSAVVVNGDGTLAGIITERDMLRRVLNAGKDPATTKVADVMTSHVRAARASDEVVEWLRQMSNERFRHVPVVDDDNKPIKIMSQGDFVSYTWPELLGHVGQKARDTIAPNRQIAVIVVGVLIYALLVPVVFNLI